MEDFESNDFVDEPRVHIYTENESNIDDQDEVTASKLCFRRPESDPEPYYLQDPMRGQPTPSDRTSNERTKRIIPRKQIF